ncbi:hypothetical protein INT46_006310 [Mucor plumbeus]|uniref:Uncharacterized protein n=1 Tax=Mucor plumbeus TaxID=97098 RepID=A0A8H7QP01_9FUNG|nr:hypothetical protein INT46_006310 [Mucor plumbeus]
MSFLIILVVGTSKKRQTSAIKNIKRGANRQKVVADPNVRFINQNLGTGFQLFTRKLPFDTRVKERYRNVFINRILSANEDVRQLLFRAQICIYRRPFWYSICQLVNNRRVTNSNTIPPGMLDDWNNFRRQHPTILYKVDLASDNSQCLSEACLQVSVTYSNALVETFEQGVMSYLYYLAQNIYMVPFTSSNIFCNTL